MNDFSLTLSESNVSAWSCSVLMKLSISDPINESSSAAGSDVLLHLHTVEQECGLQPVGCW